MRKSVHVLSALVLMLAAAFSCADEAVDSAAQMDEQEDYVTVFYRGLSAYERQDFTTALSIFTSLVKQGDPMLQLYIGSMYERGEGVAEDAAEAARWYRLAADQGYVDAQLNLAEMYFNGIGVARDHVQAYKWWSLAAAQGDDSARESLALVTRQMTAAQIDAAQKLVAQWQPNKP